MQAWLSLPLSLSLVTQLFKFFHKYRPESKAQKRERLRNLAKTKAKGGQLPAVKKIIAVKYGIHNITRLIEQKRAVLVAIAHDVDPIEVEEFLKIQTSTLSFFVSFPLSFPAGGMVAIFVSTHECTILHSEE